MGASENPAPSVRHQLLAAELRAARRAAEQTQEQVAAAMGWSPSKLSRIETGRVSVSGNDLQALLRHYQAAIPLPADNLVSCVAALQPGREYIGPINKFPSSRIAGPPESKRDAAERQYFWATVDDHSLERDRRWHQARIDFEWQGLAQFLVILAGSLALILAFLDLVKVLKLPGTAADLTIGCLASGSGGYALRTKLTRQMRRSRDHDADGRSSS